MYASGIYEANVTITGPGRRTGNGVLLNQLYSTETHKIDQSQGLEAAADGTTCKLLTCRGQ